MACIWNNVDIKYQNNVIYFDNWAKKGITHVNDLLENNSILSFQNVQSLIGTSPELYLQYIVVHSALSRYLKNNTDYVYAVTEEFSKLYFNDKVMLKARNFRNFMTNMKYSPPCCVRFWLNKLGINIEEKVWLNAKETTETRLKELQWKILHNIYPTNILLLKMGLTNNDKCPYCIEQVDYIEHFFFYCSKIHHLWKHVETLFYDRYNIAIILQATDVLICVQDKNGLTHDMFKYLTHLILIGKMCISKFRYGTPLEILFIFQRDLTLRGLV
eukprot:GHVL01023964.1.p1 GENE.GHVL01023964.1~~GHVL01023964.1.p1  ORF type:complete len:272 (+),score=22.79 GHVL01023964.1:821-1636(+)